MTYYYYISFMYRPAGADWGYGSVPVDMNHTLNSAVLINELARRIQDKFNAEGKPATELIINNFILLREEP